MKCYSSKFLDHMRFLLLSSCVMFTTFSPQFSCFVLTPLLIWEGCTQTVVLNLLESQPPQNQAALDRSGITVI